MSEDKTKVIYIGENEYKISPWMATRGMGYMKRLTKVAGPSITALFKQEENESIDTAENAFGKAVELLCENIDKDDVVDLVKAIVSSVRCNGKDINFDTHFSANYLELFKLVFEVLKVNYGSFFMQSGIVDPQ